MDMREWAGGAGPDWLPGAVLGLDTSAGAAVGLIRPGAAAVRAVSGNPRGQVEELTPMVAAVLNEAELAPADLAGIAVGTGPAPYTGLRIGLVTARALGFALDRPVWGVCSLDAVAFEAAARLGRDDDAALLATGDARRREVYWATYGLVRSESGSGGQLGSRSDNPSTAAMHHTWPIPACTGTARQAPWPGWLRLTDPAVGTAAAVAATFGSDLRATVIAGGGAVLYPSDLPPTPGAPTRPDPVWLAVLAAGRAAAGADTSTVPLYLRRPDAAVPAASKRASLTKREA